MSLELAKKIAERATQKANELQVSGAFAVVDDSGNLVYLEKLECCERKNYGIKINK